MDVSFVFPYRSGLSALPLQNQLSLSTPLTEVQETDYITVRSA
jgi:hypothetical protein